MAAPVVATVTAVTVGAAGAARVVTLDRRLVAVVTFASVAKGSAVAVLAIATVWPAGAVIPPHPTVGAADEL